MKLRIGHKVEPGELVANGLCCWAALDLEDDCKGAAYGTGGFMEAATGMSLKSKTWCKANQHVAGCATMAGELGAAEMNEQIEIKSENN